MSLKTFQHITVHIFRSDHISSAMINAVVLALL